MRPSGGEPPRGAGDETSRRRVFIVERPSEPAATGDQSELEVIRNRLRQLASWLSVLSCC